MGLYGNKFISNDQLYISNLLNECVETDRYLSKVLNESFVINEANIIKTITTTIKSLWEKFKRWAKEMFSKLRSKLKKSNKENKEKLNNLDKMMKDLEEELEKEKNGESTSRTIEIYDFNLSSYIEVSGLLSATKIKRMLSLDNVKVNLSMYFDENTYNEIKNECDNKFNEFKLEIDKKSISNLKLTTINISDFNPSFQLDRCISFLENYTKDLYTSIDNTEKLIDTIEKSSIIKMTKELETKDYDDSKILNYKIKLLQNDIVILREIISLLSSESVKAEKCLNHNINVLNSL